MTTRYLDAFFQPNAIALIGGDGDRDVRIARNLMRGGFKGPVMPVDPKRWALEGALTYPDIASLPLTPDLAVITRPPGRGSTAAPATGRTRSACGSAGQRLAGGCC